MGLFLWTIVLIAAVVFIWMALGALYIFGITAAGLGIVWLGRLFGFWGTPVL